jgi:hypothetical protein
MICENEKHFTMKKLTILALLCLSFQFGHSQTFAEWFKQKKTQIKYLVQQIAALQVYTDYLEKGYSIVQEGTHVISDIKHGDFNLHNDYFNSLKSVNPVIRNSSRIVMILADQADIIRLFTKMVASCIGSDQFTNSELNYIRTVFSNMISDCSQALDELMVVISDGELEMKDDERIAKIETVYNDMQDKYAFTQSFCKETSMLAIQRMMEGTEADKSKKLFGVQ